MILLISEVALVAIVIATVIASIAFMGFFIFYGIKKYQESLAVGQEIISDRDLILLLNSQKDNVIDAKNLAIDSGLSLGDAQKRLSHMANSGIVNRLSNSKFKTFYELRREIKDDSLIKLSEEPFLTIEDLFKLFEHHEYKMSLQDICVSTGLPLEVIKKEMKYFEKEGIVHSLMKTVGFTQINIYILQDAYKKDPQLFQHIEDEVNLDLEKIYQKVNRVRRGL